MNNTDSVLHTKTGDPSIICSVIKREGVNGHCGDRILDCGLININSRLHGEAQCVRVCVEIVWPDP